MPLLLWYQSAVATAKTLTADPGSYVLTGTDVTLRRNLPMVADAGSYALIGTDVTLRRNLPMVADPGAYLLTGTDAGTYYGKRAIDTAGGSYTLLGTDATLRRNLPMVADGGLYALTGTTANVLHGWKLDATTAASYTLTGTDATPKLGHKLDAATAGSYALTGSDASPILATPNKIIIAAAGSYSLLGTTTATLHSWKILAGDPVALLDELGNPLLDELGNPIYAEGGGPGIYALTGSDVTLTKTTLNHYSIVAGPGTYLLTGTPVTLISSAQPALPTRGEWPERKRKKRRQPEYHAALRARDALRAALDRLYDGGEYDAPLEALEEAQGEAQSVVNALTRLADVPLAQIQAAEDLMRRIQEMIRLRLLDEARTEAATQIAQLHLNETIDMASKLYRRIRYDHLARVALLLAE